MTDEELLEMVDKNGGRSSQTAPVPTPMQKYKATGDITHLLPAVPAATPSPAAKQSAAQAQQLQAKSQQTATAANVLANKSIQEQKLDQTRATANVVNPTTRTPRQAIDEGKVAEALQMFRNITLPNEGQEVVEPAKRAVAEAKAFTKLDLRDEAPAKENTLTWEEYKNHFKDYGNERELANSFNKYLEYGGGIPEGFNKTNIQMLPQEIQARELARDAMNGRNATNGRGLTSRELTDKRIAESPEPNRALNYGPPKVVVEDGSSKTNSDVDRLEEKVDELTKIKDIETRDNTDQVTDLDELVRLARIQEGELGNKKTDIVDPPSTSTTSTKTSDGISTITPPVVATGDLKGTPPMDSTVVREPNFFEKLFRGDYKNNIKEVLATVGDLGKTYSNAVRGQDTQYDDTIFGRYQKAIDKYTDLANNEKFQQLKAEREAFNKEREALNKEKAAKDEREAQALADEKKRLQNKEDARWLEEMKVQIKTGQLTNEQKDHLAEIELRAAADERIAKIKADADVTVAQLYSGKGTGPNGRNPVTNPSGQTKGFTDTQGIMGEANK